MRSKWPYWAAAIVIAVLLAYPVAVNLLLYTDILEREISRKPEKLKVQWSKAWSLLPGWINVEGFRLDVRSEKTLIRLDLDKAVIKLSLRDLLERKVNIGYADIQGFAFSHAKRPRPSRTRETESQPDHKQPEQETVVAPAATVTDRDAPGKKKPPWVVELKNVSATDVRSIQIDKFQVAGRGTLRDYAMRLVTKGGPLRIDSLNLDMNVDVPNESGEKAGQARFRTRMQLAENIPKLNKGKKLFEFMSGQFEVQGDASGLTILRALIGSKYNLKVAGDGELDLRMVVDAGKLASGSRIDFRSDHFGADFLELHASGHGQISGSVNEDDELPVMFKIRMHEFKLNRSGASRPYMEGNDLSVELAGARFLLHRGFEDERLVVNLADAFVQDLSDYNLLIPDQANLRIVSGVGNLYGTVSFQGDTGFAALDLTGTDVVLDVNGNTISADLGLSTRLSNGSYETKTYDLSGTRFRLDDAHVVENGVATKEGWWGEVDVTKGNLVWTKPVNIDAEMRIKMRDSEPLISLLRDSDEKKSLLDWALTVNDVEAELGIRTDQGSIVLNPILIKGRGLEIISKLDILKGSINGDLFARVRGVPVTFEIQDSKAKFKRLGGKSKIKKKISESLQPGPHLN